MTNQNYETFRTILGGVGSQADPIHRLRPGWTRGEAARQAHGIVRCAPLFDDCSVIHSKPSVDVRARLESCCPSALSRSNRPGGQHKGRSQFP